MPSCVDEFEPSKRCTVATPQQTENESETNRTSRSRKKTSSSSSSSSSCSSSNGSSTSGDSSSSSSSSSGSSSSSSSSSTGVSSDSDTNSDQPLDWIPSMTSQLTSASLIKQSASGVDKDWRCDNVLEDQRNATPTNQQALTVIGEELAFGTDKKNSHTDACSNSAKTLVKIPLKKPASATHPPLPVKIPIKNDRAILGQNAAGQKEAATEKHQTNSQNSKGTIGQLKSVSRRDSANGKQRLEDTRRETKGSTRLRENCTEPCPLGAKPESKRFKKIEDPRICSALSAVRSAMSIERGSHYTTHRRQELRESNDLRRRRTDDRQRSSHHNRHHHFHRPVSNHHQSASIERRRRDVITSSRSDRISSQVPKRQPTAESGSGRRSAAMSVVNDKSSSDDLRRGACSERLMTTINRQRTDTVDSYPHSRYPVPYLPPPFPPLPQQLLPPIPQLRRSQALLPPPGTIAAGSHSTCRRPPVQSSQIPIRIPSDILNSLPRHSLPSASQEFDATEQKDEVYEYDICEDPEMNSDVKTANSNFIESSEELYNAMEESRWILFLRTSCDR